MNKEDKDYLNRLLVAWSETPTEELVARAADPLAHYFICDSTGKFCGVQLQICCGGPGVWLDTHLCRVIVSYGGETGTCLLPSEKAYAINAYYEDLFYVL